MIIDEQLAYLKKGTVDVIREKDLRKKLERAAKTGKAAAGEAWVGSDGAPDSCGAYGGDPEAEGVSGAGHTKYPKIRKTPFAHSDLEHFERR